jgi:DNA-binding NarL/FixJ family response regulator
MGGGRPRADTGAMENRPSFDADGVAALQVFIVEDSQPVRERLEELLGSIEGARCAGVADSADAAIQGIVDAHPDAVLLDIALLRGSGFDVLRALQVRAPDVAVYVLSNHTNEPYRRMALQLGARAFFDKTTQIADVRELLSRRALRGQNPQTCPRRKSCKPPR